VPPFDPKSDWQASQLLVEALHTGVAPVQSVSARQATHWFETVSQSSGAGQSESATQSTHSPVFIPVSTQALPPSMAAQGSVAEHGPQLKDDVLHTGFWPLHCASLSQPTQVPVASSQTPAGRAHWVWLLDEHWPQAPLG
jgi:hypothetical protein